MIQLRVVLAEDGDLLRAGITALLSSFPDISVVGSASDLQGLLTAVEEEVPDVVLTDIRMPPRQFDEGIRAASWIRHRHPGVGVVVLTQYAEVDYALELIAEGSAGRGYLLKERVADAEDLVGALRTVAAGGSVIDPQVVHPLVQAGHRRPDSPLGQLTPRELEVLTQLAEGHSNSRIARELVVTERAVEKHVGSIFTKLGLSADDETNRRVAAVLVHLRAAGVGAAGVGAALHAGPGG